MDLRSPRLLGAILLSLPVLAFVLERLIETDAEAIEEVIEDAGRTAERREWDAFREAISPDYSRDGRDRDEVVAYVRREVLRAEPMNLRVDVQEVVVEGGTARARAKVRFSAWSRPVQVEVEVRLAEEEGRWRITAAWTRSWE